MAANGRIPTSQLAALPARWSNKGEVEYLRSDAYASLSRALSRAVADSGENFQIWDAYRSLSEQVAMLKRNYYAVSGGRRSGDRSYGGVTYRRRSGRPATASPGYSNHGNGLAIDIHHGGIQSWFQTQGRTYGWTWNEGRRLGEAWHMVYDPALDQMTHEGVLDHAAVQKAVGASVDGKIGTGTVAKIKAFQKAKGLTADGKVGAATKAAMGLGKASSAPARPQPSADPTPVTTTEGKAGTWYARDTWTSAPKAAVVLADHPDRVQTEIYIHWPGTPGVIGVESLDATKARILGHHEDHVNGEYTDLAYNTIVTQAGDIFEGRGIDRQAGANGGTISNRRGQSILVLVGNDEIPTADCVAGIQKAIAMTRDVHKQATSILGHLESPDASTECCGPHLMALVDNGMLEPGAAISAPATAPPSSTADLPTGKALLMALINAPDFPLLRTPGNRCYYGPASGPITSVSGKSPNSMNPGEITGTGKRSGAEGLKTWQKRMNARGYSLTVDGRYGDATEKACKNLQRLAGIAQDGKIGPDAWHAAWILPVVS